MKDSILEATAVEGKDWIRCMLIPLRDGRILLPHTLVAEVIDYRPPEPIEAGPDWFLGQVDWRWVALPLVSWETLMEADQQEPGRRARIVALYGMKLQQVPYLGLVSAGIPRLVHVHQDNLSSISDPVSGEYCVARGQLDDDTFWVPDLDALSIGIRDALDVHRILAI
jgi:chemosensory pili system protein ChpC